MKKILAGIIFIMICCLGCRSLKPAAKAGSESTQTTTSAAGKTPGEVDFSEPSTWLLGYFTPAQLRRAPYSSWYNKGYDEYEFNSQSINKLLDVSNDDITIKIVMGTWCSDSRREVPRFMRIMNIWQFPEAKIKFIGVDREKHSPVREIDSLNIERVPTVILYKNNVEAGRIIETPVTSLEQDIVNILTKKE